MRGIVFVSVLLARLCKQAQRLRMLRSFAVSPRTSSPMAVPPSMLTLVFNQPGIAAGLASGQTKRRYD